jgi:tRNA pseudouridine38-40 synthase
MSRYCFKYYYIGLDKYYGSQRQPEVLTIEGQIIDVLKKREYIHNPQDSLFESASRTDRYVSAKGAVFAVNCLRKPILMELNSFLPKEIGIWAYADVPDEFSPRFNAIVRQYKYIVPQSLNYLEKKYNFDLNIIKRACKQLEGTHNFQNFCKRDSGVHNTIRKMERVDLKLINDTIILDFKSEAFLRQQIRRIVKKLIDLGKGIIHWDDFLELFNPTTFISYQPANPRGLILWDIKYNKKVASFKIDKKSIERMKTYFFNQKMEYFLQYRLFSLLQENNLGKKSL